MGQTEAKTAELSERANIIRLALIDYAARTMGREKSLAEELVLTAPGAFEAEPELRGALRELHDECSVLGLQHKSATAVVMDKARVALADVPGFRDPGLDLELVAKMLDAYIESIKVSGDYERWHYIPEVEGQAEQLRAALAKAQGGAA